LFSYFTIIALISFSTGMVQAGQLAMKNGDKITGEITKIWDKKITIEPEYADDFEVDLDAVAYIDSERDFEVETVDGREMLVKLTGADESGNQILVVEGETIAIPLLQIAKLDELEDYFDWESHIDFNATVNKGNTDNENFLLSGDTKVKFGDHRHLVDLKLAQEAQDGVTTKDQSLLTYSYNWLFREPWFLGLNASGERDPIKELDRRITLGVGIGYDIWDDPWRNFNVQAFTSYQNEEIAGEVEDNALLGWTLRLGHDFFSGDLELFHNHTVTTNVAGRDNSVLKSTTGSRFDITDLLYANLQVDFDYETDPPAGTENEDLTFVIGVGAEF
jgi:putative salt-induced outer membrane protein YdiY